MLILGHHGLREFAVFKHAISERVKLLEDQVHLIDVASETKFREGLPEFNRRDVALALGVQEAEGID